MNRLGFLLSAFLVSIIMTLTAAPSLSVSDNGNHYAKGHHKAHKHHNLWYVPGQSFSARVPYGHSKAVDNGGGGGNHYGLTKPHRDHHKGHKGHRGRHHVKHPPKHHVKPPFKRNIHRYFMGRHRTGHKGPVCVIVGPTPPTVVETKIVHDTRTKTETIVRRILLSALASLVLAALGTLAMFLGYIMGQKDGERHENDFVKSLIERVRGETPRTNE